MTCDELQKIVNNHEKMIQNLIQRLETLERKQAMNHPLRGPDTMINAVGKFWKGIQ